MTDDAPRPALVRLDDRALIRIAGPDWRSFLQGLVTQDVETLQAGETRYAALLTPQGRLLYDLFIHADADGAALDVATASRDALLAKLKLYRLRAKVEIAPEDGDVWSASGGAPPADGEWRRDPRLAALGWRSYGAAPASVHAPPDAYDAHRLALGVPDLARDELSDSAYALEANFDLLHAVDFKKGCFVGQETTSRMKRRSVVKSRLVPLTFEGPAPPLGTEVLRGGLRAGEVRSGRNGRALALLRLDRAVSGGLTADERAVALDLPPWLEAAVAEAVAALT